MKKLLFAAVAASLIFGSFSMFGCSDSSAEPTLIYTLSEDGTHYIVSGVSGKAKKLKKCEVPATYSDGVTEALPVTEIGDKAFSECVYLYEITLPDGLQKIGDRAFVHCAITEIDIPDTVTYIGTGAFGLCTMLTSVTIPQNVTYIGDMAFKSCNSLQRAEVYAQITDLKRLTFYNSVTIHAGNVYSDASLEAVVLPSSLKRISDTSLYGNPLTDIYFMGTEEEWNEVEFYTIKTDDSGNYVKDESGNYVEEVISGKDVYSAVNLITDDNPTGTVTVHCNYTP